MLSLYINKYHILGNHLAYLTEYVILCIQRSETGNIQGRTNHRAYRECAQRPISFWGPRFSSKMFWNRCLVLWNKVHYNVSPAVAKIKVILVVPSTTIHFLKLFFFCADNGWKMSILCGTFIEIIHLLNDIASKLYPLCYIVAYLFDSLCYIVPFREWHEVDKRTIVKFRSFIG